MSRCARCGKELTPPMSACPTCAQEPIGGEEKRIPSVDAEVVDTETRQSTWSRQGADYQQQSDFTMRTWVLRGGQGGGQGGGRGSCHWQGNTVFGRSAQELSCLPALVTFVIAMSLGICHGFLACLGFLFFYALGSAVAFGITLRRTVRGQRVYVWLHRFVVWIVACLITLSL